MNRHVFSGDRRRGFVMIAVLVVVMIIMILMVNTWLKQDPVTQQAPITEHVDKADHAAVMGTLQGMNQQLQMMQIEEPGKTFTIEEIRAKLNPAQSRSGGEYVLGTDNKVYHTGFPDLAPPPDMMAKVVPLQVQQ